MEDSITYLRLQYDFSSQTGEIEECRYINKYDIKISECTIYYEDIEEKEAIKLIGKAKARLFLHSLCFESNYLFSNLFESINNEELGSFLCGKNSNDLKEEWADILVDSFNNNILYLDRVEILPDARGKGYGKQIIKDIIYRSYGSCGLILLKAYPLQLESCRSKATQDEWETLMKFEEMEQMPSDAKKSLCNFYKSMGFTRYKKSEYFYLIPSIINKKFDQIDLEKTY